MCYFIRMFKLTYDILRKNPTLRKITYSVDREKGKLELINRLLHFPAFLP